MWISTHVTAGIVFTVCVAMVVTLVSMVALRLCNWIIPSQVEASGKASTPRRWAVMVLIYTAFMGGTALGAIPGLWLAGKLI
jgi:hypothetical protein